MISSSALLNIKRLSVRNKKNFRYFLVLALSDILTKNNQELVPTYSTDPVFFGSLGDDRNEFKAEKSGTHLYKWHLSLTAFQNSKLIMSTNAGAPRNSKNFEAKFPNRKAYSLNDKSHLALLDSGSYN